MARRILAALPHSDVLVEALHQDQPEDRAPRRGEGDEQTQCRPVASACYAVIGHGTYD